MAYLKPLPAITELNQPFWDALTRHEFVVPRCEDCGDYNWVPCPACRSCLSERQAWTPVSGHGTVYSYTVSYRGPGPSTRRSPTRSCSESWPNGRGPCWCSATS